jgi:hypothetical protein
MEQPNLCAARGERSGLSEERKLGRKGQERSSRGQEWSPRSQGDDSQSAPSNVEAPLLVWLFADPVRPNGDEQGEIVIPAPKNHEAGRRSFNRLRTGDSC